MYRMLLALSELQFPGEPNEVIHLTENMFSDCWALICQFLKRLEQWRPQGCADFHADWRESSSIFEVFSCELQWFKGQMVLRRFCQKLTSFLPNVCTQLEVKRRNCWKSSVQSESWREAVLHVLVLSLILNQILVLYITKLHTIISFSHIFKLADIYWYSCGINSGENDRNNIFTWLIDNFWDNNKSKFLSWYIFYNKW